MEINTQRVWAVLQAGLRNRFRLIRRPIVLVFHSDVALNEARSRNLTYVCLVALLLAARVGEKALEDEAARPSATCANLDDVNRDAGGAEDDGFGGWWANAQRELRAEGARMQTHRCSSPLQ